MKCPVNFSRSLAILFFVSSWVPALLLGGGGLSWPPPPSFWPPPVLGKAFTAVVGVTPGLKAFPSCLIDNTALARPFLAGLSRLGGSPKPATTAPSLSKFCHYPHFGGHRAV